MTFASEVWLAARRLVRSPGFAILAIGTLMIGIGVNSAMLALMDALLFRPPFHVADAVRVVSVQFFVGEGSERDAVQTTTYPSYTDIRSSGAFAAVAAYATRSVSVGVGRDAGLANAMLVSREFFSVLGPRPELGSLSIGGIDVPDAGDRVVIAYGFWRRYFGGQPQAIGRPLIIDGRTYSVAGVAPLRFQSLSARQVDFWLPLEHASAAGGSPKNWRTNQRSFWLGVVGRLRDGDLASAANHRVNAVLRNRRAALGDDRLPTAASLTSIVPGRGDDKPLEAKVSLWLAGVSAFVLLIACANVSNLVLARTFAQRREFFIRLALGASQGDLRRRLVADAFVLVVTGGLGSLAVSMLMRNAVSGFLSADIPLSRDVWDARAAGIMIGCTALALALLCVVSLAQLRALGASESLLRLATDPNRLGRGTRRALLASQAGLCLALLFVAGLFASSLRRLEALDLGSDLDRTIQLTINAGPVGLSATEKRMIYERARDVLAQHPNVERVTLAAGSPYLSGNAAAPWTVERGAAELWSNREVAYQSAVGAGFFSTVGARSLRGRDFSESDRAGAQPVAIVNTPLAKVLWPSRDPLGECMWLDNARSCIRVIGVLNGVWKFRALERDKMAVYLPLAQVPDATPGALFIRPRRNAQDFVGQARAIVQALRPDLPAVRAVLLREFVDPEFRPWRLGATVFSAFAGVALLIASIGLYGVVAVSTALRVRELGIRMALGARRAHMIRLVVGEGVTAVACGLVLGAVLSLGASHWLGRVLFETSPRDAVVLAQTALLLLVVSAIAAAVPTVRVLRANPAKALRADGMRNSGLSGQADA